MGLLDLLFPKRCLRCRAFGSYICPDCFATLSFASSDICLVCNRGAIDSLTHPGCRRDYGIDGAFTSLVYTGLAKKLLYAFKHKPYLTDIQEVLADLFYEGIIQKEEFHVALTDTPLLVSIPLYKTKLKKRGYNQAEILSRRLAKKLGLMSKNVLLRLSNTPSQFSRTREERIKNMKGAFGIRTHAEIAGRTVFLVDDVIVSGATLSEAAETLKKGGVRQVFGLAFAHNQRTL